MLASSLDGFFLGLKNLLSLCRSGPSPKPTPFVRKGLVWLCHPFLPKPSCMNTFQASKPPGDDHVAKSCSPNLLACNLYPFSGSSGGVASYLSFCFFRSQVVGGVLLFGGVRLCACSGTHDFMFPSLCHFFARVIRPGIPNGISLDVTSVMRPGIP